MASVGICLLLLVGLIESMRWLTMPPKMPTNRRHSARELILEDISMLANPKHHKHVAGFELPILTWWTPFSSTSGIKMCTDERRDKYTCYFTSERQLRKHPMSRAIFFYGTQFSPLDLPLPRSLHEDWALIHEESPKNNQLFSHGEVMRLFNHTATFRSASDVPLTLQYLESIDIITDESFLIPVEEKTKFVEEDGLGLVAYVQSSCDNPSGRDDYVKRLMNHVKVDSYGYCLHNKDLPPYLSAPDQMKHVDFLHLLAKYKFVLAIENAVCSDYVTEKLWKVLQVGSVPVYHGAPNVRDWLPNELSAVFIDDYTSPEELASHLKHLHVHHDEYIAHLQHKPSLNSNPDSVITNVRLEEELDKRTWGASEQQQLAKGNFVEKFECLVCTRVAKNHQMGQFGFAAAIPYAANEEHYGCPAPVEETGGTLRTEGGGWWEHHWRQAKYEAQALQELMLDGADNFTTTQFYKKVLQIVKTENNQAFIDDDLV